MSRMKATPSHLPSLMLPCPYCGRRFSIKSVEPTKFAAELQDVTHACTQCGTELVRTVRPDRGETRAA